MFRRQCLVLALVSLPPSPISAQLARPCRDTVSASSAVIAATLRAFGATTDTSLPAIRVCGATDKFVAAVFADRHNGETDYGPRIVFMSAVGAPRVIFSTKGLMDSNVPDLYSIQGPGRWLILADFGNEGSWGIGTYEITAGGVRELPELDIGVPGEPKSGDPDESAFSHLRAGWIAGRWTVAIDTAVVLNPNQEKGRRVVGGRGKSTVFYLQGSSWIRSK